VFHLKARFINFCGRFLFGSGALEKVGDICEEMGLKGNVVLINDEVTWRIAGEKISELLKNHGFKRVETTMVEKGAVRSEIDKAREKIRSLKPSVVFGIGGGVNMDIAKASAFLEKTSSITVPTIFSTDAMTSLEATFRGEKRGVDDKPHEGDYDISVPPVLACIVDTGIIKKAPWKFQAAGFADYIAKICAIHDWNLAYSRGKDPVYNEYAIMLAKAQVEYLIKNATRIRKMEEEPFNAFLQTLMNDGFLMEMAGNSRILFGSEHIVAQGLMEEHVPGTPESLHGQQVSLGNILMAYLQGEDWMAIKKALEEIGAPVTAEQIGLSDEAVIRCLTRAKAINESWFSDFPHFYTILMEKPLTKKIAEEIARETEVI